MTDVSQPVWRFLLICLVPWSVALGAESIVLPRDPDAPVIEMWYLDSDRIPEPDVVAFANGRLRLRAGDDRIDCQIDVKRLNSLVEKLLATDRLQEITTEAVARCIEQAAAASGLSSRVSEAADTLIVVRTAERMYRVQGPAVGLLAVRYPEATELQCLNSAQRRIENLRAIGMLGGEGAAQQMATATQSQVASEYGENLPITCDHLTMVRSLPDGTKYCQFVIHDRNQPGQTGRTVTVFHSPGEAPRVTLLDLPNPR